MPTHPAPQTRASRLAAVLGLLLGLASLAPAAIPVTDRPLNNAPGVFRFAIVADRAGGIRPGVFEDAVAKLQRLQPEFVISVGDLIDGYTTDPAVWNAQWVEFERIVARLEMPFYFVPGNHDISNPELLAAWKQRRGDPWYSFVHENVLVLCLHTEDRPDGGLGAGQIAWAKKVLAEQSAAHWTLVFMHRPLWLESDQAGYEQIAAALHGRPYTVFAGHAHHYRKSVRDGMNHYVLATSGGSSKSRGVEYGEFDQVTWVTMKPAGPAVVNLALNGIVADDVIDDTTAAAAPDTTRLAVPFRLLNPTDFPLQVQGDLTAAAGVRFEPAHISQVVPPHQTAIVPVELVATGGPVMLHAVNEAKLGVVLTGAYELKGRHLALPAWRPVRFDWPHPVPPAAQPVVVDGDLGEWPAGIFTRIEHPMRIDEAWDWTGPADGSFRFAVQQRDGRIYVAVETFDDRVITASDPAALQDKLLVRFRAAGRLTALEAVAGRADAQACVRATATGLVGEFVFPLAPGERSFRLNVGWLDHDRPENTKPAVLWWRDEDVAEFGVFAVEP